MKKYLGAAAAFALTAALMTGCGCTNRNMDGMITDPTVTSTTVATMPSTDTTPTVTTHPSTATEHTTEPSGVMDETIRPGNGDPTAETGTTHETTGSGTAEGRARHAHPDRSNTRR